MHVVFDMMGITLEKLLSTTMEKLSAASVVARATIRSLLILAYIISLASSVKHPQVGLFSAIFIGNGTSLPIQSIFSFLFLWCVMFAK